MKSLFSFLFVGTRKSFDHLISDSKAPKRPEMESGMTTPPKMRRVAENDYEIGENSALPGLCGESLRCSMWCLFSFLVPETPRMGNSHLRKVSVSESNVLLDEEVLTDPKIQALLLTVLVRKKRNTFIYFFICYRRFCQWTFFFSRPHRSNTLLTTLTRGFCTSTWPKLASSFQRFSLSCE